jgi:hypothetical protein
VIQTAKLNDVDQQAWLADVLARAAEPPIHRLDELLPWHDDHRNRSLTMQSYKVHSVRTLALVAKDLGEDVDWLADIANDMEPEDGLIGVYDPGRPDGTMAFTEFGI